MSQLTGAQRKYLRGLAHSLKPLVRVGKDGLTRGVLEHLDAGLESHELIKVKLDADREIRRQQAEEIDAELGSENVGGVGHVAIFYRPARDPEQRSVRLPGSNKG
ncbi:MAG: YhbY family RNA-binding protein [Acidobacteriota bacterium]